MNEKNNQGERATELRRDERGLALVGNAMELRCDFAELLPRIKPDRLGRELLVRAAKTKGIEHPTALDCTAGLGHDSFLLAAAGFEVRMFERDSTIAALLEDALARGLDDERLSPIVGRMRLIRGDSLEFLASLPHSDENPPDVIYLDPMFPERQKSASVKKKFQLLHTLERPCSKAEESALLKSAVASGARKVVVKRPAKGPYLAGIKPSYAIAGKAVRYDVIACASTKLG